MNQKHRVPCQLGHPVKCGSLVFILGGGEDKSSVGVDNRLHVHLDYHGVYIGRIAVTVRQKWG